MHVKFGRIGERKGEGEGEGEAKRDGCDALLLLLLSIQFTAQSFERVVSVLAFHGVPLSFQGLYYTSPIDAPLQSFSSVTLHIRCKQFVFFICESSYTFERSHLMKRTRERGWVSE